MCGICGIYGIEDSKTIKKMCNSLIHRGPDDYGYFLDDDISLGHRRLSIIDLETGHQPVHNENEDIWVILNGEIYNYLELKENLNSRHEFYTNSDTELLVHLYEEYGENLVKKINGMFAFAIWDKNNKKLVLARDPLGKKPLYYYCKDGKLFFASEIKGILNAGIKKQINQAALSSFLCYQYTVGINTLFEGIKKLPAGHVLTIKDNELKIRRYWNFLEDITCDDEPKIIKKLKKLLQNSAQYRVISDVPVGAFLSGGLDSSAATALTRPLIDYDFHTFSIGFESFSELKFAKIVSDHLDTIHHEIIITPEMVEKNIDKITWHNDEPLGDAAIINNYILASLANDYVKVIIAGEAGDELFAGYPNYRTNLKLHSLLNKPILQKLTATLINNLPDKGNIYRSPIEKYMTNMALNFTENHLEKSHMHTTRVMTNEELTWLSNLKIGNIEKQAFIPCSMKNPLNKMLAMDCKNLLPEKFLMKADKATMANSLEERLPLMDKNVVQYAFSIPPSLKLKNGTEKYILKMAVKDRLPPSIIKRKKQGFGTPLKDWIIEDRLKDKILEIFYENTLINDLFKKEKMEKIAKNLKNNNNYRIGIIWNIFTLGLWYDVYFEEKLG